jgi:hypothetical protein
MLSDSACMNCSKQTNLQTLEVDWWLPGAGGREESGLTAKVLSSFLG